MNEVAQRWARLVLGWVRVFGRVYHLGIPSQLGQLSIAKLHLSLGSLNQVPALTGETVTSAWWQVTLYDPIRHVGSRSGEVVAELLYPVTLLWLYFTTCPIVLAPIRPRSGIVTVWTNAEHLKWTRAETVERTCSTTPHWNGAKSVFALKHSRFRCVHVDIYIY